MAAPWMIHPVLRALLRVMAAPDSTLAAGLGGYARTFVRHHLWRMVWLNLAPRGVAARAGQSEQVWTGIGRGEHIVAVTRPAPARFVLRANAPKLTVFDAKNRQIFFCDSSYLGRYADGSTTPYVVGWTQAVGVAPIPGTSFLYLALTRTLIRTSPEQPKGSSGLTVARINYHGAPAPLDSKYWPGREGYMVMVMQGSPCARRLYVLVATLGAGDRRSVVHVLAAKDLAELRSWRPAWATPTQMVVTDAEHVVLARQMPGPAWWMDVFGPEGEPLWCWKAPEFHHPWITWEPLTGGLAAAEMREDFPENPEEEWEPTLSVGRAKREPDRRLRWVTALWH
jgi:hypothetical protein